MKKITFTANRAEKLLKSLEKNVEGASYSAFSAALRKKDVAVNGIKQRENSDVVPGDEITIFLPDSAFRPNFTIFYEDENVLFVNKGKEIEVCDGEKNVADELKKAGKSVIPVHRIDRNTSGLVMFAKTEQSFEAFLRALKEGRIKKYYEAEVFGTPENKSGVFIDYMKKDASKKFVSVRSAPAAGYQKTETYYSVIKSSGKTALLCVRISGGFTHQIRACLAYHDLPIIGDGKYGRSEINRAFGSKYQRLTAKKLVFDFAEDSCLRYLNDKKIEL
jgi:pseudouridylate synthase